MATMPDNSKLEFRVAHLSPTLSMGIFTLHDIEGKVKPPQIPSIQPNHPASIHNCSGANAKRTQIT